MSIKEITTDDLRGMDDKEGLILQGCGGDLQEWVDGINNMLTEAGVLKEGTKFENCSTFRNGEVTCLLFPFEDVKLDIGRFAMWRLQTYGCFSGTWLSDYVPNRLGGFLSEQKSQKPDCALIGENGNIFNLMGIAARVLREHDMKEQSEEMCNRIHQSGSYEEALNIIGEYVNITSKDGMDHGHGEDVGMHM